MDLPIFILYINVKMLFYKEKNRVKDKKKKKTFSLTFHTTFHIIKVVKVQNA